MQSKYSCHIKESHEAIWIGENSNFKRRLKKNAQSWRSSFAATRRSHDICSWKTFARIARKSSGWKWETLNSSAVVFDNSWKMFDASAVRVWLQFGPIVKIESLKKVQTLKTCVRLIVWSKIALFSPNPKRIIPSFLDLETTKQILVATVSIVTAFI